MPHRAKGRHKARHRTHTFKAANLSLPAQPPPDAGAPESEPAETRDVETSVHDPEPAPTSEG